MNTTESETFDLGYFTYPDKNQSALAYAEQEKIKKLESQIDYKNPKVVYSLYCKIISGKVFKSPEGILYLLHLQDYLYSHEEELDKSIPLIPYDIGGSSASNDNSKESFEEEKKALVDKIRALESEKSKAYRNLKVKQRKTDNAVYKIIIVALAALVIFMLIITMLSGSPNILNYRNEIQNEYSDWEQKLEDKEAELNAREAALENK